MKIELKAKDKTITFVDLPKELKVTQEFLEDIIELSRRGKFDQDIHIPLPAPNLETKPDISEAIRFIEGNFPFAAFYNPGRQTGKTTLAVELAKELSKTKKVLFVAHSMPEAAQISTHYLKDFDVTTECVLQSNDPSNYDVVIFDEPGIVRGIQQKLTNIAKIKPTIVFGEV